MVPSRRNGPCFDHRRLDVAEDEIEQRLHAVVVRTLQARRHPALLGRAVEDREIELLVGGVERGEQVEHLVDHLRLARASARSTLLMTTMGLRPILSAFDTTNLVCGSGPSAASTSTSAPSTMLRMRSTSPPKSAWPGVSTMLMRVPFQIDRSGLGQDGDAALALEIVGIHGAFDHALVLAVGARLLQQPVDQGGLAVVDVRDDGDVAKIHYGFQKPKRGPRKDFRRKSVFAKDNRIAGWQSWDPRRERCCGAI